MENYIGEIRMFAGTYAPEGWFFCNGQTLNISEYDTLFALIGTTYGGDGQQTFAVPNFQSRVIVGQGQSQVGSSYPLGMTAGTEAVTLTTNQMPVHTHPIKATLNANQGGTTVPSPAGALPANSGNDAYSPNGGAAFGASEITDAILGASGGSQPHNNIQPVQAINYIIAWQGIYPSQA